MARHQVEPRPIICGGCGTRNHPERRSCQRCGAALVAPASPPGSVSAPKAPSVSRTSPSDAPPPREAVRRWPIVAALVVIGGAAIGVPAMRRATATPVAPAARHAAPASAPSSAVETPAPGVAEVAIVPATPSDDARAGTAAFERGDFGTALDALQKAVAANPDDAVSLNNLGQTLVRLGRASEALPQFQAAVALSPSTWSYQFNLARASGLVGDWAGAVAAYDQANQLFPDDHVTMFNLALALQKVGRQADALPLLERVATLTPDDASVLPTLGAAYEQAGRPADAANTYTKFLSLAPDAPDAAAARARLARLEAGAGASTAPQPQ